MEEEGKRDREESGKERGEEDDMRREEVETVWVKIHLTGDCSGGTFMAKPIAQFLPTYCQQLLPLTVNRFYLSFHMH